MSTVRIVFSHNSVETSLDVVRFTGTDGLVRAPALGRECPPKPVRCELRLVDTGRRVWIGIVQFEPHDESTFRFIMLVRSSANELVEWGGLPSFLSVADGGYEALDEAAVGRFLDDLLQFQSVTRSLLFTGLRSRSLPTKCRVVMEDVTSTDAVLLEFERGAKLPVASEEIPLVVAVELFEVTYILVGFVAELVDRTAIFTLTGHVYRDQRHAGRRFLEPFVSTPQGEIVEVSDFGLRIRTNTTAQYDSGQTLEIEMPGFGPTKFKVIHGNLDDEGRGEYGCMVQGDVESSANWIRFLLGQQYPLLRFRTRQDYPEFWKMLEETGYSKNEFCEINQMIRDPAETEWSFIDSSSPSAGATVVAIEQNKIIGTIGVTRVGQVAWTAQVAAMSNNPDHIPHTRSLYSWRTRFMLQQQDGEYHVAFFDRDKQFLDRFFRKFYLQEFVEGSKDIIWEEWKMYTHILPRSALPISRNESFGNERLEFSSIFEVLNSGGSHPSTPSSFSENDVRYLKGRPFQHLCQYFSSAWLNASPTDAQANAICANLRDQQIFTVRSKSEIDITKTPFSNEGRTVDEGWDVVWLCRRLLMLKFLSNSLRALEVMNRKYGSRSVA